MSQDFNPLFPFPILPNEYVSVESNKASSTNAPPSSDLINKIKSHLKGLSEAIQRWGITATNFLPFSTRGLLFNSITPLSLFHSPVLDVMIKLKKNLATPQSFHGGISDAYIDLEAKEHAQLRANIVEENFRYAAYMYRGFAHQYYEGTLDGILISGKNGSILSDQILPDQVDKFPSDHQLVIKNIKNKLQNEMGFQVDQNHNFYHTKTGSMFNIVYDTQRKEVVVCFMGLGNETKLGVGIKEKLKISLESHAGAVSDWLGGIPPSARQAIEMGAMLKEMTNETGMTPVLVGHSHGGGLAQIGAVANGIKGIIFNPRPPGAGMRRHIGQNTIEKNAVNIIAISSKGDFLGGIQILNKLAAFFERITGIIVPRTIGIGYQIPPIPGTSMIRKHNMFYEQLLEMQKSRNI